MYQRASALVITIALLMLAACTDVSGPKIQTSPQDLLGLPAPSVPLPPSSAGGSLSGHGQIGVGSRQLYDQVVSFDFEVSSNWSGTLFATDWNDVREDETPATMTVNHSADPATGIAAYRNSSSACLIAANGVEFDGVGREDWGNLVAFTIKVCDNGPGLLDYFEVTIPVEGYDKSGPVTQGDIAKH